jgi:hypothetical protein
MPGAPPVHAAPPVPDAITPQLRPPPGGWYPNSPGYPGTTQDYSPAAGAFATPGRKGAFATPGRKGGGPQRRAGLGPAFTKRGPLVNVLLFGVAPALLAGLVIGAFVLVAPGKPASAAHTSGFRAGPGITAQQAADAVSPTSAASLSPANSGKDGTKGSKDGKRASMPSGIASSARARSTGAATGTKKSKKTTRSAKPATVAPHNLGAPDFDSYCRHIGLGTAQVTANNAYGWSCTVDSGVVISVQDACAWTYHLDAAKVINVSTDYYSADSWQCWRVNGVLGQLDVASYCSAAGLGAATLKASNAYGWYCDGKPVYADFQAGCQLLYHSSDAIARFAVFADPYSWQCWH